VIRQKTLLEKRRSESQSINESTQKEILAEQRRTNRLLRRLLQTQTRDRPPVPARPEALATAGRQIMFGSGGDGPRRIINSDGLSVYRYPMEDDAWLVVKQAQDGEIVATLYEDKHGEQIPVVIDSEGNIDFVSEASDAGE
jgi:hypothetical protein